ncbi:hypothetical protein VPHD479_0295 [Vibrio phage D479]
MKTFEQFNEASIERHVVQQTVGGAVGGAALSAVSLSKLSFIAVSFPMLALGAAIGGTVGALRGVIIGNLFAGGKQRRALFELNQALKRLRKRSAVLMKAKRSGQFVPVSDLHALQRDAAVGLTKIRELKRYLRQKGMDADTDRRGKLRGELKDEEGFRKELTRLENDLKKFKAEIDAAV